ncbi:unnamed protein product [Effrenium voratum]|nr:unnamed protein product [Effrenium voratum]
MAAIARSGMRLCQWRRHLRANWPSCDPATASAKNWAEPQNVTLPFLALYLPLAGCFCYPERSYWQDPLGVLATRLFFHEVEALWTEHRQAEMDLRELYYVQESWGMLQLALTSFSLADLARSGWHLLLLAKAFYLFFEVPAAVSEERERLWNDAGADGRFFRLLWRYASRSEPLAATMRETEVPLDEVEERGLASELQRLAQGVSPALRPAAQLLLAELQHDESDMPSCRLSALDDGLLRTISELLGEVPSVNRLIFHTFPVLPLLERLLSPTAAQVAGLMLCTPPLWRGDLAASTAARIHASGDTGCKELQNLIHGGDIDCVVDVGAMFGACAASAAHAFHHVNVRAYEKSPSSARLMQRTAHLGQLSMEARAVCLVSSECVDCEVCSTLEDEYPFACKGRILLWMSQMSGPLHSILKGGRLLFRKRLVHSVAVMTIPKEISGIKRALGTGYWFELRWHNTSLHSTVLVVATARKKANWWRRDPRAGHGL